MAVRGQLGQKHKNFLKNQLKAKGLGQKYILYQKYKIRIWVHGSSGRRLALQV
jgi:hypothetical protein